MMSNSIRSFLRRWLPSVAAGAVYGLVIFVGWILMGREPMFALLLGLTAAIVWAALSIWIQGPVTRWRDRRFEARKARRDARGSIDQSTEA